jgi:hypothetical protein
VPGSIEIPLAAEKFGRQRTIRCDHLRGNSELWRSPLHIATEETLGATLPRSRRAVTCGIAYRPERLSN